jgi:hypothetical protein
MKFRIEPLKHSSNSMEDDDYFLVDRVKRVFINLIPSDFEYQKFPITSLPRNCRVKILNLLKDSDDFLSLWKVKMTCKKFSLPDVPVNLPTSLKDDILQHVLEQHIRKYSELLDSATITFKYGYVTLEWKISCSTGSSFSYFSEPYVDDSTSFINDVCRTAMVFRLFRFETSSWFKNVTCDTVTSNLKLEMTFSLNFFLYADRGVSYPDVELGQCLWFQ